MKFDIEDCRTWFYFPIPMPIDIDGCGPANMEDATHMTYEVWDQVCNSWSSHAFLPDAINEAIRLCVKYDNDEMPRDPAGEGA